MLRDQVLALLKAGDAPCSGEGMSRTLGVSRAAVWKAVEALRQEGYVPQRYVSHDPQLERCLDALRKGFRDGVSYEDLYQRLLFGVDCPADQYLLLADFASYCAASQRVTDTYRDREKWNRMSLHNIARSGIFSADRAVADYADTIWHVPYKK